MKGLRGTLANLAELKARFDRRMANAAKRKAASAPRYEQPAQLETVEDFGTNPGNLGMFEYVPAGLADGAPLVVALHGCTQSASGYDFGSGWSTLASAFGFAVVFPEQSRANNPNNNFNWFLPSDAVRGAGEAHSIAQMTEHMIKRHGLDRRRVLVVGLSAGGAMSAAMLAAYPDVFAGGAIIAGLPQGGAVNVLEALQAMVRAPDRSSGEWGDLVRAASPHQGPWPKVSLWHGSADTIVAPGNLEEAVKQWRDVHGCTRNQIWNFGRGGQLVGSGAIWPATTCSRPSPSLTWPMACRSARWAIAATEQPATFISTWVSRPLITSRASGGSRANCPLLPKKRASKSPTLPGPLRSAPFHWRNMPAHRLTRINVRQARCTTLASTLPRLQKPPV